MLYKAAPYMQYHSRTTVRLQKGDGIVINSGRLHFVKAVTPGAELAEFALPPAFFERFLERVAIQAVQPLVESRASQVILRAANDSEASLLSTMKEIFEIRADNPCAELYLVELICRAWRQLSDVITEQEEGRVEAKGDAQGTAAVRERNVKRMLAFIHAHYSEPIGVDDLALNALGQLGDDKAMKSQANCLPPTQYTIQSHFSWKALVAPKCKRRRASY